MFIDPGILITLSPFGEAEINWGYARQEAFRFSERSGRVLGSSAINISPRLGENRGSRP